MFLRGAAAAGFAALTRALRRRRLKVLRWVVCLLLRVCVNSSWHGWRVSGRFEAGHYVCAVRGA